MTKVTTILTLLLISFTLNAQQDLGRTNPNIGKPETQSGNEAIDICSRSEGLISAVETALKKKGCTYRKSDLGHIERLVIWNNKSSIEASDFLDLPNIKEIEFKSLNIDTISRKMFVNLQKLEKIVFSFGKVNRIETGAFSELQHLKTIKFDQNPINFVDDGAFTGLFGLEELSMIQSLKASLNSLWFKDLKSLVRLDLEGNNLSTLNGALKNIRTLLYLNLLGNPFQVISKDDFLGTNSLKELRFGSMQLYGIPISGGEIGNFEPGAINHLRDLEVLAIKGSLTFTRTFLKGLTSLKVLSLVGDKSDVIDEETFRDQKQIEQIELRFNEIPDIRVGAFSQQASLNTLIINGLTSLTLKSGTFVGLKALTYLGLRLKETQSIEPGAFDGLYSLQRLSIAAKKLLNLSAGVFRDLVALKELSVSLEEASTIEPGVFEGLKSLETLLLEGGKVEYIASGTFQNLLSLKKIQLLKNGIKRLQSGAFKGLPSLTEILIQSPVEIMEDKVFQNVPQLKKLTFKDFEVEYLNSRSLQGLSAVETFELVSLPLKEISRNNLSYLSNLKELTVRGKSIQLEPGSFGGLKKVKYLEIGQLKSQLEYGILQDLESLRVISFGWTYVGCFGRNTFYRLNDFEDISPSFYLSKDCNNSYLFNSYLGVKQGVNILSNSYLSHK